MIHKIIVAFSVGLQLGRTHAHALGWVCLSMGLFSIMSPFGGFIGTFVQSSQMDTQVKALTILIFQGVAVGTFIYVTFFEVSIHVFIRKIYYRHFEFRQIKIFVSLVWLVLKDELCRKINKKSFPSTMRFAGFVTRTRQRASKSFKTYFYVDRICINRWAAVF